MKIISYELYDWLNKKILETVDKTKEAVKDNLHLEELLNA